MQVEALRSIWVEYSYPSTVESVKGFKNWLSTDDFTMSRVDSPKKFEIYVKNQNLFKNALSIESIRFSINSLQTVNFVRQHPNFPKVSAWHIIQIYYAAFFSAHSLLRRFGRPFTHLEQGHSNHLLKRANLEISAEIKSLASGPFKVIFDPNFRTLTLEAGGNSHEGLWKSFSSLLTDIGTQVLSAKASSESRTKASLELTTLKDALTEKGAIPGGNWLSTFRNEINYQSPEPYWFPFSGNQDTFIDSMSKVQSWKSLSIEAADIDSCKSKIDRFIITSFYIIQLCHAITLDYITVAPKQCKSKIPYQRFVALTDH